MSALSRVYTNNALANILPDENFTRGFVFAISASPEIPLPEVWMPWLMQHTASSQPKTLAAEDVQVLSSALIELLRDTLSTMRQSEPYLPNHCTWSLQPKKRASLHHWLTGLLAAHQCVEGQWQMSWDKAPMNHDTEIMAKDLSRCLKLFSTLARPELYLENMTQQQREEFESNLPVLANQLPAILQDYVRLAGELAQFLPNQFEMFTRSEN